MTEVNLKICRFQGEIFEKSIDMINCGSSSFIRNFMYSDIASHIDNGNIMLETLSINQIFNEYIKQYGNKKIGKKKYNGKSLYWIGYIYRYWCQKEDITSKSAYRLINGSQLYTLYSPYHTMSPDKVIKRIMETKNEEQNDDNLKLIMKRILF